MFSPPLFSFLLSGAARQAISSALIMVPVLFFFAGHKLKPKHFVVVWKIYNPLSEQFNSFHQHLLMNTNIEMTLQSAHSQAMMVVTSENKNIHYSISNHKVWNGWRVCRLTQRLASPQIPQQRADEIFQSDYCRKFICGEYNNVIDDAKHTINRRVWTKTLAHCFSIAGNHWPSSTMTSLNSFNTMTV